ncbi:probable G-protein coupled receptor Mth-like 11 [Mya arenaria]|uniref:probable G-protein coupled receptor Mth-like 11 n=1 Tax=Mya arenaria TaxID=6604 RepID=UPI0022E38BB2|nr:probable G-protein coupled receptor Mth-like 11 [Mya arenaria]
MCPAGLVLVVTIILFPTSFVVRSQTTHPHQWGYSRDDDYDPFSVLEYDSDTCAEMRTCGRGLSYPDKSCNCDELCVLMNDCCDGFITEQTLESTSFEINADQFSCETVKGLVLHRHYGVLLVSKCSPNWTEARTKSLCESDFHFEKDLMKKTPVSDGSYLQIMYKNMYCAYCNFEYNILFWSPEHVCFENMTNVRMIPFSPHCRLSFTAPLFNSTKRVCGVVPPISTCGNKSEVKLIVLCEQGHYNLVYDEYGNEYRNEHCAQCNGVDMNKLYCMDLSVHTDIIPKPTEGSGDRLASLTLLVNLNLGTFEKDGKIIDSKKCSYDEIYDIMYDKCREVFCPPTTFQRKGRCILQAVVEKQMQQYSDRHYCTWAKLDPAEYIFTNDSNLFILSAQETYNDSQFHQIGTDVFICHSLNNTCFQCESVQVTFNFDKSEEYLSTIGLVISILSLLLTVIVYLTFPQLLNTPGKILMSMVVSLLLAQLLFLISSEVSSYPLVCKILAICDHYFFLAAFCWMNVIAFDLWKTFSSKVSAPSSSESARKTLLFYSFYGFVIPMCIVCAALILEFGQFENIDTSMKPYYGRNICWISSRNSLILFFLGPLALFKLFDMTSFIFTAVHIARARKQGAAARRKKNTCSLLINIKLSLVMGLTWVFAFVANVANLQVMWYLFIIFNTFQGLFIAISFLCTRKVVRLVHEKYAIFSSTLKSSAETETTFASKSNLKYS